MVSNFSIRRVARLSFLLSLSLWAAALGATQTVIVHVDSPPLAWGASNLETKLITHLSRNGNGRIVTAQTMSTGGPEFPGEFYDFDNLVNWGTEVDGNYLLLVDIDNERLQTKKSFHLPLVFHKYQAVGVIEGELRLIDIRRGKSLIAEPFKVERKGPRIFQATMDDNINDPDIHLTAPEKTRFFERLEEKLALQIVKRVRKAVRLR